jgi:VanZ family protein
MVGVRRTLSLWLPVLLWAGLIFGLSSIPSLSSGLGSWDEVLRKGAHTLEYAILALLLRRALRADLPALAVAVAYAATDEFHQSFVAGRHGTPIDVAIDGVGAALGLLALLHARRRYRAAAS